MTSSHCSKQVNGPSIKTHNASTRLSLPIRFSLSLDLHFPLFPFFLFLPIFPTASFPFLSLSLPVFPFLLLLSLPSLFLCLSHQHQGTVSLHLVSAVGALLHAGVAVQSGAVRHSGAPPLAQEQVDSRGGGVRQELVSRRRGEVWMSGEREGKRVKQRPITIGSHAKQ